MGESSHRYVGPALALMLAGSLLFGCDIGQYTQTQETPAFIISVTNKPHPLVVGEPAELYVTLRKDRRAVTGCQVLLTQHSPAPRERLPSEIELLESGASGVYRGDSHPFDVDGTWKMEFSVRCLGKPKSITFPFDVSPRPPG